MANTKRNLLKAFRANFPKEARILERGMTPAQRRMPMDPSEVTFLEQFFRIEIQLIGKVLASRPSPRTQARLMKERAHLQRVLATA